MIAADLNGVVVVPQDSSAAVLDELRRRRDAEREYTEAVARGDFSNAWVDTILSQNGVSIDETDA